MISPNQLAESSSEAVVDDKDSKLITDKDGMLMRWAGCCGDKYKCELDTDGSILQTNRSCMTLAIDIHCSRSIIGLYRDVWIAAIA